MIKIKFIKEILIGSTKFKIIWDKNSEEGQLSYPWGRKNETAYIKIGLENHKVNPIRTLEIIIHELKEIINIEQATRMTRLDETKAYEFHYTHKEHTEMCSRLAGLLNEFIK